MGRRECNADIKEVENDNGVTLPAVFVECPDCGAITESFGTGPRSVRRCLALMKEACTCDDAQSTYFFTTDLESEG